MQDRAAAIAGGVGGKGKEKEKEKQLKLQFKSSKPNLNSNQKETGKRSSDSLKSSILLSFSSSSSSKKPRLSSDSASTPNSSSSRNQSSKISSNSNDKKSSLPDVPLFSNESAKVLSSLTSKESLKSKDNPITHSRIGQMTQHYTSSSTGHQKSNKVGVSAEDSYLKSRYAKLQNQAVKKETEIFKGVIAHVTGYTGNHRNTVLIRLLQTNGATVLPVPSSSITHTISSSPLSAKKTHEKLKKGTIGNRKWLIKPEWIMESIEKGRKVSELGFQPQFGATGFGAEIQSNKNGSVDGNDDGNGKGFGSESEEKNYEEAKPISKLIKGKKTQRSLFDMMVKK